MKLYTTKFGLFNRFSPINFSQYDNISITGLISTAGCYIYLKQFWYILVIVSKMQIQMY